MNFDRRYFKKMDFDFAFLKNLEKKGIIFKKTLQ